MMQTQAKSDYNGLLGGLLLVAAVLALALTSCGGKATVNSQPAPTAPGQSMQLPQGMLAQLPPLPPRSSVGDKAGSAMRSSYISGIGLYQGEGYGVDGSTVTLPSTPGAVVWAMYIGSTTGDDIDRLEVNVDMVVDGVYVAISDYAHGRWKFLGKIDGPQAFDLPDGDYTKENGGYYLLLLTYDGGFARHNYTIAKYDDGQLQGPTISGTVRDENNQPIGGASIYAMPGGIEAFTDMEGIYVLSLPGDGDYTISVYKDGYEFTPVDPIINVAGANVVGVDFAGTSLDIRGTILVDGQPLAGVKLTFQGGGPVVYSRNNGTYEFSGMGSGMYTIIPKLAGYSFNPASIDVDLQGMDIDGQDFTATGGQATFSISGKVTDTGTGLGLAGAAVQLLPEYEYAFTDDDGNYSFTGLAPDFYQLKAFKQLYTVTPQQIDVPIINQSASGIDFNAQPLFRIEGYVKGGAGSFPLWNVSVTLTPGGQTTQTNSLGYFSFAGLSPGNYTVTPSSGFYTFNPLNRPAVISSSSVMLDDFIGSLTGAVTYTNYISGSLAGACTSCHSDTSANSVPPFLRNYNEANTNGVISNNRVQNGSMPPGTPLSAQAKELWQKWINDGRPQ